MLPRLRLTSWASPTLLASSLAGTSLLAAGTASAQTSLHGVADATVAFDSNIRNDGSGTAADLSITQSHGLLLLHRTPRSRFSARYTRSFVFFVINDVFSNADDGAIAFTHALSEVDDIGVTLDVNRRTTNLIGLDSPSATTAATQPVTPVELLTPALSERYSRRLAELWYLDQTSRFSVTRPLDQTDDLATLVAAGATLGPSYEWENHSFGLEGQFDYYYLSRLPVTQAALAAGLDTNTLDDPIHQLIPGASLVWRWRFAERWASRASGGAVMPLTPDGEVDVFPVGRVDVGYVQQQYGAALSVTRGMAPNPLTQQIFLTTSAIASGFLPILAEENLLGEGSTGFAHNRIYTTDESLRGRAMAWTTDVGVRWLPESVPFLSLGARYQLVVQFGSTEPLFFQNFTRNVVSATVGFFLPQLEPEVRADQRFQPAGAAIPGGGRPDAGSSSSTGEGQGPR